MLRAFTAITVRRRHAVGIVLLGLLLTLAVSTAAKAAPPTQQASDACAAAKALLDSGRYADAEKAYVGAVGKADSLDCAQAGLAKFDSEERECATAAALQGADRDAEALTAYEAVLKTSPASTCAQNGVRDLDEGFLDDPGGSAQSVLAWLGLIALLLGGVGVAVALVLVPITRIPGLRDLWPASQIRALRVGIEPFDDTGAPAHQGPGMAALVRSKIASFGDGSRALTMIDSQAAIEETVWTKVGAINDQAKAVSALLGALGALYPRRHFQVTGALHPEGAAGPGLSVSLRKGEKLATATTLWAEQFGLAAGDDDAAKIERVQRLAVPAAAWISHTAATAAGETPGGSSDPISWALFKTGIEWENDGNIAKATNAYEAAIGIDRENWGALANLGSLEDEEGNYEAAIPHLQAALRILEK